MFPGFRQQYKMCAFYSTSTECCVRHRCMLPSPFPPPVLLTKLHDSSVSQLGIIIIWPAGVIIWASPKGCCMYVVVTNLKRSNSMSIPWLCTFRKSELEREKTTQTMVRGIQNVHLHSWNLSVDTQYNLTGNKRVLQLIITNSPKLLKSCTGSSSH